MSASHFSLHTENNAMYPPLTHESFPPSSPVTNKVKGCDPRLLLKEYLLWHKTQRPDLEFYWDKILERLEAQQISLQGIRDWGKKSGWESRAVPRDMGKQLADGVKIFL